MDSEVHFSLMDESFTRAATCGCVFVSFFRLAGRLVRLRVAGGALAPRLRPAFGHLACRTVAGATPDLTIDLWDEAENGVECPLADRRPAGALPGDRYAGYRFHRTVVCFDRQRRRMVGCVRNGAALSLYEQGRPLHPPLARWLNDYGMPLIHGGLVATNGRGILLAGAGGSGKSTTAIVCLEAGYRYVSDDLLALEVSAGGGAVGHSLYNSTYLEALHLDRFPNLAPHAVRSAGNGEDKILVLLSRIYGSRLAPNAPIQVIALPRVSHRPHTSFSPAPKSKALFALAPSSRKINKNLGMGDFASLVALVEKLPCYWLDVGEKLDTIPDCVGKLLAGRE
jgi:hypothetical protein